MCENISASRASTLPAVHHGKKVEKTKYTISPQRVWMLSFYWFLSRRWFHSISGPESGESTLTFQVIYHCCRRPRQDLIRLARAPITESDNRTRANQPAAWAFKVTLLSLFLFSASQSPPILKKNAGHPQHSNNMQSFFLKVSFFSLLKGGILSNTLPSSFIFT